MESKQLTLLSVSELGSSYSTGNKALSIKNFNNEPIQGQEMKEDTTNVKYMKTTFDKCYSDFISAISTDEDKSSPHFFIVDDIIAFHYQDEELLQSIRKLRSTIENAFSVLSFPF